MSEALHITYTKRKNDRGGQPAEHNFKNVSSWPSNDRDQILKLRESAFVLQENKNFEHKCEAVSRTFDRHEISSKF